MNLFGIEKISVGDCVGMTINSLKAHALGHSHWVIAWSGGKDSTATMTLVISLILSGQIPAPKSLTVMYADTRMELPPLSIGAQKTIVKLEQMAKEIDWLNVRTVMAKLDKRYFVYMLGRGVPPPNNKTLRWCTRQIKLDPMQDAISTHFSELGEKILTITGVRIGESAIRDGRISMSCTKNGAECGQGWYQNNLNDKRTATLAPIIHWRVCNVWDWLMYYAPLNKYGKWDTQMLAQAYGGDKAKEKNARTGCLGCPLANQDGALDALMEMSPEWSFLSPLKKLRPIYREMRGKRYRLRKIRETKKDGTLSSNPYRVGPLTMEARSYFLNQILLVQEETNIQARELGFHEIDILNQQEVARIRELWSLNTWPKGWTGEEPIASDPYTQMNSEGYYQGTFF